MTALLQDLRFALRLIVKNPGFAAAAIIVLALGIGANSALFSVVNTVLIRPLPYAEAEGHVLVSMTRTRRSSPNSSLMDCPASVMPSVKSTIESPEIMLN